MESPTNSSIFRPNPEQGIESERLRHGRVMQDWTFSMTAAERLAAGHRGNCPDESLIFVLNRKALMSEGQDEEDGPCLHCMMVELVDQFFEEYPAATGDRSDTIRYR
jgi:hypothetical protein